MKRILAFTLIFALTLALFTGCAKSKTASSDKTQLDAVSNSSEEAPTVLYGRSAKHLKQKSNLTVITSGRSRTFLLTERRSKPSARTFLTAV